MLYAVSSQSSHCDDPENEDKSCLINSVSVCRKQSDGSRGGSRHLQLMRMRGITQRAACDAVDVRRMRHNDYRSSLKRSVKFTTPSIHRPPLSPSLSSFSFSLSSRQQFHCFVICSLWPCAVLLNVSTSYLESAHFRPSDEDVG